MTWRVLLLGLVMIVAGALGASAQDRTADQYFHTAAQQYIDENIQQAKQTVQAGLEAHPSDTRLRALLKKLQQEREKQQGAGNPSGTQNQQNKHSESNASSGSKEQDSSSPSEQRGPQDPNESERSQQQQNSSSRGDADESADERSSSRQGSSGSGEEMTDRLTQAQAERILHALENQERQLLREIQRRGRSDQRVKKDW